MKKITLYIISTFALVIGLCSCGDDWLSGTRPRDFLTAEQTWNDNVLIKGVLANLYGSVNSAANFESQANMSLFDDLMYCGLMNEGDERAHNEIISYDYGSFRYYDYAYIYRINDAIEHLAQSKLDAGIVESYTAEFRFLRAYAYFQMVIRMGGVPLITHTSSYENGIDVTTLQVPRSSEAEIYNFVYDECMEIKDALAANNASVHHARANKYTALALASRAMLYAGSIAKYNALMPNPISSPLQSGVVGMTGEDPKGYYEKALACAEEIIKDGYFKLQGVDDPSDRSFYNAVCVKDGNTEVIWCKDYSSAAHHGFTYSNSAPSMMEDTDYGSYNCPTLQLVESFKPLDGSPARLADVDANGKLIAYKNIGDIFEGRDVRLRGTCLLPGQEFKGATLDIQAGVALWKGDGEYELIRGYAAGSKYEGDGGKLVGVDGPINDRYITNTGFNLRKYIDEAKGSSLNATGSTLWFVYFRMGEVYLNAAEAAMELGRTDLALEYVNKVRERAGFGPDSWTAADLTIDNLLNERRCELVAEDHRFWDMKRTRKADQIWNGVHSETSDLYALYPYRIIGGPDDGGYVFERLVAPRFKAPRFFRIGNYYTSFSSGDLSNNPKLVQNPNI